jgi:hypothetical protein
MAQTIKIKRGGIENLISSSPSLVQGELLLATGSLNGLNSTFFVATASDSPSLPYTKIESIANGPTLAGSLDSKFEGLLIHSASDNKFYRYNGSAFVELPVAAGSFVGILPVANGGTGQSSFDDIVGDGKIVVTNGGGTVIGGDVTLSLTGSIVSSSAQIDHDQTTNFSADEHFTQANITTVGTVTTGNITAILPVGTVSGSSQITYSGISGIPSGIVSGSSQITYSGISGISPGIVSASVLSSPNQGSAVLITNGVSGSTIDLGLQTGDSPTFTGLTLSSLNNLATEATAVVINGGILGTRELGSNAFTSTTIGTTTEALTDGAGIQDFTFDGSGAATVAIEAAQTTITSVKNDSLVVGSATGNDIIDFGTGGSVIIKTNDQARVTVNDTGTTISGNLTVTGTTTTINSTTVELGDNIIELNGTGATNGGLLVKDVTAPNTVSGSLLWDTANDYWKGGALGSEKRIPLQDANMADNTIVLGTGAGTINDSDAFTGEVDGYYLKWNGIAFAKTNVIDGGIF